MKRSVMLDADGQVTTDPAQAVIIGEADYDDAGHLVEETWYFVRDTPQKEVNQCSKGSSIQPKT
jgi:YD repeat-containing protein